MIVVNLFGAPGAGKSTGASFIFSILKMNDINAELVTEFAKDKVWENNKKVFNDQFYIFGKQHYKISRLENDVEAIVTDAPLFNSILYNNISNINVKECFNKLVLSEFNTYSNFNYLVTRKKEYNSKGRLQSKEKSDNFSISLENLLKQYSIKYSSIDGNINNYREVANYLVSIIRMRRLVQE